MEKYRLPDDKRAQMERSPVPFAVYRFVDKRVETLVLSDGFRELFGCADREEAFYDTDDLMYTGAHPDDAARVADAALKFIVNGVPYNVVYRFRKPGTNTYRVIHATGKHVCLDNGDGAAYVWYIDEGDYTGEDVFEESGFNAAVSRALPEESVIKASSCDYLTGLPSMSHFFELAEENKKTVAARGGVPVMIYFDLCGMKFYNGKHGFSEGDKVIRAFGRLLASRFAEKNCSRFGSDRYAVCTESLGIENKLRDIFDEWSSQGREYPMIRAGIYDTSFDDADAGTACDRAKIACDAQKNIRRSTFGYFNKELLENIRRRRYIIDNIDKAISEDRIQVYYQPIVRAVNGKVCDEEALARWIDPEKGTMSPGEFIPVLEEEGLIYKLDLCVIEKVLSKLKTQEREGLHLVPQSVNLSRSDFEMCDIVGEICRRVDAAGVGRDKLTIEITESMLGSDTEFMKEQIQRFQSLGFSVWMDDFGKGYSSLDTLQSVKFQLIKFDMSFMQNFNNGESGKIILTELVKMATSLGMDTVCEGVETEEQVRFLREIGCSS